MSILGDSLKELKEPQKASNFRKWYNSLSQDDRDAAAEALLDDSLKKYPLFLAFRKAGMRTSKESFFVIREKLLSGELTMGEVK